MYARREELISSGGGLLGHAVLDTRERIAPVVRLGEDGPEDVDCATRCILLMVRISPDCYRRSSERTARD
jgi:hypothetical protein